MVLKPFCFTTLNSAGIGWSIAKKSAKIRSNQENIKKQEKVRKISKFVLDEIF
jgi:hypothetical protein